MLSDEVLDKVIERLVNRIEQGNEYILSSIGNKIDEIGKLQPTQAIQLQQMIKYGGDYNKIVKKLAEITKMNKKDIEKIFKEVAKSNHQFAKQFYDYRNVKYVPYDDNAPLKKQVEALAKITNDKYTEIARSKALGFSVRNKKGDIIFKGLKEVYDEAIDTAIMSIAQGKSTFDNEIYKFLKNIGESGVKTLDFNGKTMRLDSAMRMHLSDALMQLTDEQVITEAEAYDADGVEISVHAFPAIDHELAQGRQFSNDEFKKLQSDGVAKTYDGIEVDMHIPLKSGESPEYFRQIRQYNCKHHARPIVLGVSSPVYSNEDLQQIIDRNHKGFDFDGKHYTMYEGTQLQRKIETEIRKNKDLQILGRTSDNKQLANESQIKINQLNKKYKELSKVSGLPTYADRMKVSGYKPIKVVEKPVVERIENQKPKQSIKSMKNNSSIFVSKEEQKRINEYYLQAYKKELEKNNRFIRNWQQDEYDEMLKIKKSGYKDKTYKLDNIDDCKAILKTIHTTIEGDEINETDFRLVQEATQVIYDNTIKSPCVMRELINNRATLQARERTSGVANTMMNTITLNNQDFKDYDKFKEMCKNNTELHLYASGEHHSWWSEVAEGNETKVVITHEFGHRLQNNIAWDIVFNRKNNPAFEYFYPKYGGTYSSGERIIDASTRKIARDLIYEPIRRLQKKTGLTQKEIINQYTSMYGRSDYDEMFAETFANARLGKSNALADELIKFLIEIGEWIE